MTISDGIEQYYTLAKSTLDEIEIRRKEIHKKNTQEDDFQKMEKCIKYLDGLKSLQIQRNKSNT